jgi:hypothetical protein
MQAKRKSSKSKSQQRAANPRGQAASYAPIQKSRSATIRSTGSSIVVTHREYVETLMSADKYRVSKIPVNPGIPGSFPWLSSLANSYEFYRFEHLSLEYVPICTTSDGGQVLIALDYDPMDDAPLDRATLSSYMGAVSSPLWKGVKCVADPKSLNRFVPSHFTRKGLTTVDDRKSYDAGNWLVSLFTGGSSFLAGDLWVSYTVILSCPQQRVQTVDSGSLEYKDNQPADKPFPDGGVATGTIHDLLIRKDASHLEFLRPFEGIFDMCALHQAGTNPAFQLNLMSPHDGVDRIWTDLRGVVGQDGKSVLRRALKVYAGDMIEAIGLSGVNLTTLILNFAAASAMALKPTW